MKKTSILLALLIVLLVSGCQKSAAPAEKKKLVISTWQLNEDILREEVFTPFEKQCNCEVVLDLGSTNDRYTKFEKNPQNEIDVIELSQAMATQGQLADLFEQIDYSKVKDTNDLIKQVQGLVEGKQGPAYTLNSLVIVYNPDMIKTEIKDYKDLFNPEFKEMVSIPNLTTTFGPAMVHIANDLAGGNIQEDHGTKAFEKLAELKPNLVKVYSKSSDLANMFQTGEVALAVVGDFGIPSLKKALPNLEVVVPESGAYINFNTVNINKDSKNKDLAYDYLNWRLSAQLQTQTLSKLNENPTNAQVKVEGKSESIENLLSNAKAIDFTKVNPLMSEWLDQWNRLVNQ